MYRKRFAAFLLDTFIWVGMLHMLFADIVFSFPDFFSKPWIVYVCLFVLLLAFFWLAWRRGGGFGKTIMGLRIVDDSNGLLSFGRFSLRSIHFVAFAMLQGVRLALYVEQNHLATLDYQEYLGVNYGTGKLNVVLFIWIAIDKLVITQRLDQKSILDRLCRTNVVYW